MLLVLAALAPAFLGVDAQPAQCCFFLESAATSELAQSLIAANKKTGIPFLIWACAA